MNQVVQGLKQDWRSAASSVIDWKNHLTVSSNFGGHLDVLGSIIDFFASIASILSINCCSRSLTKARIRVKTWAIVLLIVAPFDPDCSSLISNFALHWAQIEISSFVLLARTESIEFMWVIAGIETNFSDLLNSHLAARLDITAQIVHIKAGLAIFLLLISKNCLMIRECLWFVYAGEAV